MAETVGEAFVAIRPDTKGFAGDAEDGIKKPLLGIAAAVGGAFAAIGVGKFIGDSIQQAQVSATVIAQTNAVIKSTGEVANVSASEIDKLATALSKKSGVDDEVIASGENVLLTFTNVRNEAGKGNDIFDQAAGAALDMSRALGTDLQGSVIQLGKALNDPIAGITALSRVGVSFTEDQKTQIQGFIDANDLLSAQKVILGELSKEFGGAAEAAATPIDKLKVAIGNLREEVGAGFLPVVSELADKLIPSLAPIGDALGKAVGPLAGLLGSVVESSLPLLQGLASALGSIFGALAEAAKPVLDALVPIMKDLGFAIAVLFNKLADTGVLQKFGALLGEILKAAEPLIRAGLNVLLEIFDALTPVIKIIADAFEKLAPVFAKIAKAVAPIVEQLGKLIVQAIQQLAPSLPRLVDAFVELLTAIAPLIPIIVQLTTLWVQLLPPLAQLVALLIGPLAEALHVVSEAVTEVVGFFQQLTLDDVLTFFSNLGTTIGDFFSGLPDQLLTWGGDAINALVDGFVGALPGVLEFFAQLPSQILAAGASLGLDLLNFAFSALGDLLTGLLNKLPEILQFFIDLPGQILGALGDLGQTLFDFFAGALGRAVTAIYDGVFGGNGILAQFIALPGQIIAALGDLADDLIALGASMVEWIWQGIQSLKDWFFARLDDFFGGIPSFVAGLLKGSPWLFTRDVGRDLMTDLAQGIADEQQAVFDALNGVTDQVQQALDLSFLDTQGWKDFLAATTAAASQSFAVSGDLASIGAVDAANGIITQNGVTMLGPNDTSPVHWFEDGSAITDAAYLARWGFPWAYYKNGGFTNWPINKARMAMLHGQELILNRKQQGALGLLPSQASDRARVATGDTFHIYAPNNPDATWLAMQLAQRRRVANLVTNG